ncbi:hypothetical protein HPGCJGGD_2293 [Methylobacterium haplocladii]|nr:hypothetical protein HPGCJGGD_2293 [Methylobacterium haplocladii]
MARLRPRRVGRGPGRPRRDEGGAACRRPVLGDRPAHGRGLPRDGHTLRRHHRRDRRDRGARRARPRGRSRRGDASAGGRVRRRAQRLPRRPCRGAAPRRHAAANFDRRFPGNQPRHGQDHAGRRRLRHPRAPGRPHRRDRRHAPRQRRFRLRPAPHHRARLGRRRDSVVFDEDSRHRRVLPGLPCTRSRGGDAASLQADPGGGVQPAPAQARHRAPHAARPDA